MRHLLLFLSTIFIGLSATAQIAVSGAGSYSQDFNSLITTSTATWADNSTIVGWYAKRSGTGTGIAANDGSSNSGNLYSYGTGTSTERALGTVGSGGATAGNFAIGAAFHNTSGSAVGNFSVTYTLEEWRIGGNPAPTPQVVTFWYKTSSTAITDLTPNVSTGWTAVTALDGSSPVNTATAAPLDGNASPNFVTLTNIAIPGLTLADGEYLMLKWDDPNQSGNDHGLAIDNVTVSWGTSCNTFSTISPAACGSYSVPSGDEVHNTSGTYYDTIPNAAMCDSIITIHLTINNATTSTISPVACGTYTVPSGDEQYSVAGTYYDTIPNANSCDSIITINLTFVTSITYYLDDDGDGLGDPDQSVDDCTQPDDYVTNDDDCDDTDETIGAATVMYYDDSDNDGLGDPTTGVLECTQLAGTVTNGDDCDDTDDAIGEGTTYYVDADGDGYGTSDSIVECTPPTSGYATQTGDCNDNNNAIHPGATDIPDNGIDEDCSGSDLSTALGMYQFEAAAACPVTAIDVTAQPANATFSIFSSEGTTCAPANNVFNNSGWNTGASIDPTEYNQFTVKPAECFALNLTNLSFLHRTSGTGGTPTVTVRSSLDNFTSNVFTATIVTAGQDENVTNALPAAFSNIADSVTFRFYVTNIGQSGSTYRMDNVRLNGTTDALTPQTWYADTDGDNFGDNAATTTACAAPDGYVADNTDCDDTDAAEHPGAVWYADEDGDGFGDADATLTQCLRPADYVTNDDDCDDTDENITVPTETLYVDADGDGYGDEGSVGAVMCPTDGYVANDDDCDDTNDDIHPGATEITGNGIDENCDELDGNVGLDENTTGIASVFPNPGTSEVTISLVGNWNTGIETTVLSADGKQVLTHRFETAEMILPVQQLVPGVYLIRVTDGSKTAIVRWVKN